MDVDPTAAEAPQDAVRDALGNAPAANVAGVHHADTSSDAHMYDDDDGDDESVEDLLDGAPLAIRTETPITYATTPELEVSGLFLKVSDVSLTDADV